jgi:hypothetical protein
MTDEFLIYLEKRDEQLVTIFAAIESTGFVKKENVKMKTIEVAKQAGISKSTLLRWIAQGYITDVNKDSRGWRIWTKQDLARVRLFNEALGSVDVVDIRDPRVRFAMALDLASYHSKT